jgi:sRNA-binding carbon storage regulator CsrA
MFITNIKRGEAGTTSLIVGNVEIVIVKFGRESIQIGIEAPKTVPIKKIPRKTAEDRKKISISV